MTQGCHSCKHFDLNPGEPGYSEYTPGSDMSFTCEKRHWKLHVGDPAVYMRRGLAHGMTCPDYAEEAKP